MLRPLSTYLLLIITCSFLIAGLNELHLDNFVKDQSTQITPVSIGSADNCFLTPQGKTFPAKKTTLITNFDLENEVEVETDALPTIELVPQYFSFHTCQSLFLNVYSTYSFTVIKVEFLDIFSPPPNC